jgi:hypothetical protein
MPPPSVYPTAPTSGAAPVSGASPNAAASWISSPERTPAPIRAARATGSIRTPPSRRVLISSASRAGTATPCPVAWTAIGRPQPAARRTAASTSGTLTGSTTAAAIAGTAVPNGSVA